MGNQFKRNLRMICYTLWCFLEIDRNFSGLQEGAVEERNLALKKQGQAVIQMSMLNVITVHFPCSTQDPYQPQQSVLTNMGGFTIQVSCSLYHSDTVTSSLNTQFTVSCLISLQLVFFSAQKIFPPMLMQTALFKLQGAYTQEII